MSGGIDAQFVERSGEPRTRSLPLSHVSVELGHLYMEDLAAGPGRLRTLFAEAEPWLRAAERAAPRGRGRLRLSTCFLVDEYFSNLKPPNEVVPQVLEAAEAAGVRIDYLARESGCARTARPGHEIASPAELLVGRLVDEPAPEITGARPPATRSGWLSNGQRSSGESGESGGDAMEVGTWRPPVETAARRHSIFVDVQLWDGPADRRTWSCPLLAAVWQLLRLGLIRLDGVSVVEPVDLPSDHTWPASWSDLPSLIRLNPKADPFFAYSVHSVLSARFLPVELAVRTILNQVWHDPTVTSMLDARATAEGVTLPREVLDRISYSFAGTGLVDPGLVDPGLVHPV